VGGGLLVDPIPESPLMREIMTGRDPKPGDGVIKDPIPDQPPLREGMSGREPTPGENTITDPAPEPCGRHQVNDQGGNGKQGGTGQSAGQSGGRKIVTTPQGRSYDIPKSWVPREADNGKGIVYQEPGATGNRNSIRIMEPTPKYPNGYVRYYNSQGNGQPLDVNGKPGTPSTTHITPGDQGPWPGWPTS
jgi:hypothetical protein